MPIAIKMPALSPTMEEGTLAKWLVKVGDKVSSGDIMAEIETDKATMEFEAVDEGVITAIEVPEGAEGVKVGTVIAMLMGEDEVASAAPAADIGAKMEPTEAAKPKIAVPVEAPPVPNISPPPADAAKVKALQGQLSQLTAQADFTAYLASLQSHAKIEIRSASLDKATQ